MIDNALVMFNFDFCLHGHLSDVTVRDTKLIRPAIDPNLHKGRGTNERN